MGGATFKLDTNGRRSPKNLKPYGGSGDVVGVSVEIVAPPATVLDPLLIEFRFDGSLFPPTIDLETVTVFRNGEPALACSGQGATPDPCVANRVALSDRDLLLLVKSSHASTWNVGTAVCVVPKLKGKKLAAANKALKNGGCLRGKVRRKKSPKPNGTVLSQSQKPGSEIPTDDKVTIVVSR